MFVSVGGTEVKELQFTSKYLIPQSDPLKRHHNVKEYNLLIIGLRIQNW